MLKYEEAFPCTEDARMYWNNAVVFHWEDTTVTPYYLAIPSECEWGYDDERGEEERYDNEDYTEMFSDCPCELVPVGNNSADAKLRHATGHELLTLPQWVLHRFPLEYVAVGNDTLARVSGEPRSSRAFKGTSPANMTGLPLIDNLTTFNERSPRSPSLQERIIATTQGWVPRAATQEVGMLYGIAEVLRIGTPQCMRRVISAEDATIRARALVHDMFVTERRVVVPDFPVAIIKHRVHHDKAYVLYRGRYIGLLLYSDGEITFKPEATGKTRDTRKVVRTGHSKLAMRLFADKVDWS